MSPRDKREVGARHTKGSIRCECSYKIIRQVVFHLQALGLNVTPVVLRRYVEGMRSGAEKELRTSAEGGCLGLTQIASKREDSAVNHRTSCLSVHR